MLPKPKITTFFVITIVAFSLMIASVIAASSNMKTAANAVKKGHSGNSGHTSSGDKSSKHEKDIGGSSRSSDSKGASDNIIGNEGGKTVTNKKDNNEGTNDNTNTNNNQLLTPSATPGEQQNLQSQQLPPDQSQLTTPTTPQQEQGVPFTPSPDCATNPNDPACQSQQQQQQLSPQPIPILPPSTTTCSEGTQPDANGKCPTTAVDCTSNPSDPSCITHPTFDNNTEGGGKGGGGNAGGRTLGANSTITTTGGNGTGGVTTGGGNSTLQNLTNTISNTTLSNVTKSLSLSIKIDKDPIARGDKQTITVTVSDKDSHEKVSGANVKVLVTYASGLPKPFSGTTDSSGRTVFSWSIGGNSNPGIFKVKAEASKGGYTSASGKSSFKVICDTLSRGCHTPLPRPPSPSGGGSPNYVERSPSTVQQQLKYFKESTDMPANSLLYITSTSMHKDTLGDIIITGEIKNNGTNTANFVEIIATFYDTNNQTLGNKNTFTEPITLQPKQAAPFTMYLSPNDMPLNKIDHVKYHLNWQNGTTNAANKQLPKTGSLKTTSSLQPSITTVRNTAVRNTGVVQQIPSSKVDFKGGDNSTVKVTFVSSNRDILGNYHVVGNMQNIGKYSLNIVARVHIYDINMNEIDYQYSYTSPDPVPAGSSAHFDVTLAQSDFPNVVPKYFKLGFDW